MATWYDDYSLENLIDPAGFCAAVSQEARTIFDALPFELRFDDKAIRKAHYRWKRLIRRYEFENLRHGRSPEVVEWLVSYFSLLFYALNRSNLIATRRYIGAADVSIASELRFLLFGANEVFISSFCHKAFQASHFVLTGTRWGFEPAIGKEEEFILRMRSRNGEVMHLFLDVIGADTALASGGCAVAAE